ncbi:MAG: Fructokinase [Alphaproteobacteria bacterium MarineAlpha5_Bin4]|nr:MAG: Fructokinase [Alphaproteobacteria bacterium MarineAlpha5_Bin4]|tara:strand:+ start:2123 stop:3013 length:891 start_codon:yes stop_codon:yes gene_type:complete
MKIGIDLGGTKTEGILIDDDGKELTRDRIKTEKNYEGTIKGIVSIVKEFEKKFGNSTSVGIGMPGAISTDSALVKNANSIWLNEQPLKKDLQIALDRKINLENDANCFTLSEAVDGAGKEHSVVFGVIIGTGTGGGIVVNNKVLRGKNNIAGEWGHIGLPNRTNNEKKYVKKCYCGKDGCMETYVSGPGFASVFNLTYNTEYDSHKILDDLKNEDKNAIKAFDQYVDHLARGLSLVCNVLDPDIIVLGGGMSNISYIYENIDESLKKYIFSDTFDTKIVKNFHGDSSGVRGAAWLS